MLATVILYYELYIPGAVATNIITSFGMTFNQFIWVSVIGNLVGAFASLVAGLADRWGRANLVVGGLIVTGLLTALALPNAKSATTYTVWFAILSLVEGMILVATPALIRDFSPQVGRGTAMGFWTLGPVLGSLVVTSVSSATLPSHPDWRFQFYLCGIIGLVVAVLAFFTLRELSPRLRDQLMVSMRDKVLIEARAKNIDLEAASKNHWRQMLTPSVVGPAFAISIFLLFYYIAVGFFVVYFATLFGMTPAEANKLANFYWIFNAVSLVVTGFLTDKLGVRKPFMVFGTLVSLIGTAIWATRATHPETSHTTFAILMVVISVGGGIAYTAWMTAFTETVEERNPAATATGLAVWGWTIRIVVTLSLIVFGLVLPATKVLVEQGAQVGEIATQYSKQLAIAGALSDQTKKDLTANPADPAAGKAAVEELIKAKVAKTPDEAVADLKFLGENPIPPKDVEYLTKHGPEVQKAAADSPGQWQTWWWVTFAGQLLFLPFIFLLRGRWSPKKARQDAEAHERLVAEEMARLDGRTPATDAV
ncbi:MFS transporter [Cumulibacter manganitolerans]|uniref:MFS transporter n=1 Tax=Cumulibacter manganitolerans TaxID=1884992 RepID=UPI001E62C996|nr:MFS transporter [Cumulibacter manganitolerans]